LVGGAQVGGGKIERDKICEGVLSGAIVLEKVVVVQSREKHTEDEEQPCSQLPR